MPEYLAPGVYVEEVSSRNQPIEGVGTSTAAFVGLACKGPINKAVLVTNYSQFRDTFGDLHVDYFLAFAVQQFFFQGGKRCYVVRVFQTAADQVNGGVAADDLTAHGRVVMRIEAKSPGTWGNQLQIQIEPPSYNPDDPGNQERSFQLNLFEDRGKGRERLLCFDHLSMDPLGSDGLPNPNYAEHRINNHNPFIQVAVMQPGDQPPGDWQRTWQYDLISADDRELAVYRLKVKPDWGDDADFKIGRGENDDSNAFQLTVLDRHDQADSPLATYSELSLDPADSRYLLTYFEKHPAKFFTVEALPLPAPYGWRSVTGETREFEPIGKQRTFSLTHRKSGGWPVLHLEAATKIKKLGVAIAATGDPEDLDRGYFKMTVTAATSDDKPIPEMVFDKLSMNEADSDAFVLNRLAAAKNLPFTASLGSLPPVKLDVMGMAYQLEPVAASIYALKGGHNGTIPRPVAFIGNKAGKRTLARGLHAFDVVDDINNVAIPELQNPRVALQGNSRDAALAAIGYCENRADCFFLIDPPQNLNPRAVLAYKQGRGNFSGAAFRSSFAALYYPWIKITDPLTGHRKAFPPSAALAGIFAATDVKRGVHKAPAGLQDGALRVAVDVQREVTQGEQAVLNPEGINVIRKFNDGMVVWGARTVSSHPDWRYINVRRLLCFLEESIDEGTRNLVFEPNDRVLWNQIRAEISNFLRIQWAEGKLVGDTAKQAFFVKCDEETNPPESVDLGRVVTVIGVAPSKPAEFVIFRISQWRPGQ